MSSATKGKNTEARSSASGTRGKNEETAVSSGTKGKIGETKSSALGTKGNKAEVRVSATKGHNAEARVSATKGSNADARVSSATKGSKAEARASSAKKGTNAETKSSASATNKGANGEEKKDVDLTRPVFDRNPGQLGIYIDLMDVELIDPLAYGSERFMMISVAEKLLEYFQTQVELCRIKRKLEKKGLLKGTVLDGFVTGLILPVTFDDKDALETFWQQYKSGEVGTFFKAALETRSTRKYIEATRLEIRIRCWEDEYDACKVELAHGTPKLELADHAYDILMLKKARAWQRGYTKDLYKLRDYQYDLEAHLGEFFNLCKTFQPNNLQEFLKMADLDSVIKRAKERKATTVHILEIYPKTFQAARKCAKDIKKGVCYTLAQVHAGCESEKLIELKRQMNSMLEDVMRMTEPNYHFRDTRYPVWEHKVMDFERKMFVGMITTFPCVIETLLDMDHVVDDYYEELRMDL